MGPHPSMPIPHCGEHLLFKNDPIALDWGNGMDGSHWIQQPECEALTGFQYGSLGLLAFGALNRRTFRLSVTIRQPVMTGGAGLFFGFRNVDPGKHGDPKTPPVWQFQRISIELRDFPGPCRPGAFKVVRSVRRFGGAHSDIERGSEMVTCPNDDCQLVIESGLEGLTNVTWNGQSLKRLFSPESNMRLDGVDYIGAIGLYQLCPVSTYKFFRARALEMVALTIQERERLGTMDIRQAPVLNINVPSGGARVKTSNHTVCSKGDAVSSFGDPPTQVRLKIFDATAPVPPPPAPGDMSWVDATISSSANIYGRYDWTHPAVPNAQCSETCLWQKIHGYAFFPGNENCHSDSNFGGHCAETTDCELMFPTPIVCPLALVGGTDGQPALQQVSVAKKAHRKD